MYEPKPRINLFTDERGKMRKSWARYSNNCRGCGYKTTPYPPGQKKSLCGQCYGLWLGAKFEIPSIDAEITYVNTDAIIYLDKKWVTTEDKVAEGMTELGRKKGGKIAKAQNQKVWDAVLGGENDHGEK